MSIHCARILVLSCPKGRRTFQGVEQNDFSQSLPTVFLSNPNFLSIKNLTEYLHQEKNRIFEYLLEQNVQN